MKRESYNPPRTLRISQEPVTRDTHYNALVRIKKSLFDVLYVITSFIHTKNIQIMHKL